MNKVAAVPFCVLWTLRRHLRRTWKSETLGDSAADALFLFAQLGLLGSVLVIFYRSGGALDHLLHSHLYSTASFIVIALVGFNQWYFANQSRWKLYSSHFETLSPARRLAADIGAEATVMFCMFSPLLMKTLLA